MPRPRHPIKELEAVIRSCENQGWRAPKGKKYYKLLCPCDELHMRTVHLTPSDPNYLKNLCSYLKGKTCWKEDTP